MGEAWLSQLSIHHTRANGANPPYTAGNARLKSIVVATQQVVDEVSHIGDADISVLVNVGIINIE